MVGCRVDSPRRRFGHGLRDMGRADDQGIVAGLVGETHANLFAAGAQTDNLTQRLVVEILADGEGVTRCPARNPANPPARRQALQLALRPLKLRRNRFASNLHELVPLVCSRSRFAPAF